MEGARKLVVKFRETLSSCGQTLRWFQKNYLGETKYNAMILQLNDYKKVSDSLRMAMSQYISDVNGDR